MNATTNTPVITDERCQELLAASPAPRVTPEYIQGRIEDTGFQKIDATTTLCTIEIDNGFCVHGFSACVNPANYNKEIGEKISYDNAFRQLWPLFGFLLAEHNMLASEAGGIESKDAAESEDENTGDVVGVLTDKVVTDLKDGIEKVHKESGVTSDITGAVHHVIDEVLAAA